MVLDDSQKTRYDVDRIDSSIITKQIDEYATLKSPLVKDLTGCLADSRNVFYVNDYNCLEANSFIGSDTLVFNVGLDELALKEIRCLDVHCHIESDSKIIISQIGIVGLTSTYVQHNIQIHNGGDVDVSIDLSDVNMEELIYLIKAGKFDIFVDMSCNLSICSIVLSDMALSCIFGNVLQDEIDAVRNRYETFTDGLNFEDYVKYDDLNNLPPLDDEGDVGEIHSYIDEVIGNLELDLDFEFGLSGVDDTIRIRSRIIKGSD